ncbi:MAG: hypothetical protein HND52_19675 [Ignavibacteriae bacterium]|nr:hypothetical protein [Ignavibacteriota bacterium]NOH00188.1 hypothetical protein [Ignavibacteriota bacterium]
MEFNILILLIIAVASVISNLCLTYFLKQHSNYDVNNKSTRISFSSLSNRFDNVNRFENIIALSRSYLIRFLSVSLFLLIVAVLLYGDVGLSYEFLSKFTLLNLLLVIGIVDFFTLKIPNKLIILLFIYFVIIQVFNVSNTIVINLITTILIVGLFLMVNVFTENRRGKTSIGYGDIKLIGMLTLIFDVPLSIIGIWFSALVALPGFYFLKFVNNRFRYSPKVPFGFFIFFSFALIIIFQDYFLELCYKYGV